VLVVLLVEISLPVVQNWYRIPSLIPENLPVGQDVEEED
jgi:hypothetical protein